MVVLTDQATRRCEGKSNVVLHTGTSRTSAAVEGETEGRLEIFNKKLREHNLVGPQRIVPVLPVEH